MEVHKPGPIHSWRDFLKEVGTIVLGVIIALTAEQTVEALHWHGEVQSAEKALKADAIRVVSNATEREQVENCILARLDQASGLIEASAASGRLAPAGDLAAPPIRAWSPLNWNGFAAAQIVAHLPPNRLRIYTSMADVAAYIDTSNIEERVQWTQLSTLAGPGRAFTAVDANATRMAASSARTRAMSIRASSSQLAGDIHDSGLLTPADWKGAVDEGFKLGRADLICADRAPPPATYSAAVAPTQDVLALETLR